MREFRVAAFVDSFSLCRRAHVYDRLSAREVQGKQKSSLFANTIIVTNYNANIVIICDTFSIFARINPKNILKRSILLYVNLKFASATIVIANESETSVYICIYRIRDPSQ